MISCDRFVGLAYRVARLGVQVHDQIDRLLQGFLIDLQALQDAVVVLLAEGLEVLVKDLLCHALFQAVRHGGHLQEQAFAQVARTDSGRVQ
jgi:hypothetical protein